MRVVNEFKDARGADVTRQTRISDYWNEPDLERRDIAHRYIKPELKDEKLHGRKVSVSQQVEHARPSKIESKKRRIKHERKEAISRNSPLKYEDTKESMKWIYDCFADPIESRGVGEDEAGSEMNEIFLESEVHSEERRSDFNHITAQDWRHSTVRYTSDYCGSLSDQESKSISVCR